MEVYPRRPWVNHAGKARAVPPWLMARSRPKSPAVMPRGPPRPVADAIGVTRACRPPAAGARLRAARRRGRCRRGGRLALDDDPGAAEALEAVAAGDAHAVILGERVE